MHRLAPTYHTALQWCSLNIRMCVCVCVCMQGFADACECRWEGMSARMHVFVHKS